MFGTQLLENFWISLEIMGLGMAGIFTVILVIMGCVALLTKLSSCTIEKE